MRVRLLAAALLCSATVCGLLAASASSEPRPSPHCNGAKQLCRRPFNRVVLAGAHNAMSTLDLGWKIPNQTAAIPDQLRSGIRALLIDTHYGRLQPDGTVITDDDGTKTEGQRGLYLCHVACQLGASPPRPGAAFDPQVLAPEPEQRADDRQRGLHHPDRLRRGNEAERPRRLRLPRAPGTDLAEPADDDRHPPAGPRARRARRRRGPLVPPSPTRGSCRRPRTRSRTRSG